MDAAPFTLENTTDAPAAFHAAPCSVASLMQPRSSTHVPVTFGELYGPLNCKLCNGEAWTIWVTPEEKETHSFEHIFRYHGEVRCDKCGPPNSTLVTCWSIPHELKRAALGQWRKKKEADHV